MIFISAGHYPAKPGAKFERFVEHDEAIIWADELVKKIDNSMLVPVGVLKSKVAFINERIMNGDIAIEIHFNAAVNAKGENVGKGSETLYYPGSEKGEKLAAAAQSALAEVFPPDRGIKEGWYRMDPARGPDFFLAKTKCPAIIIEPDFVHRFELIIENRETAIDKLAEVLKENYDDSDVEEMGSNPELDSADTDN